MTNTQHKSYHGRKIRIPSPRPGWTNPFAGKIGDVTYAGWDDWYLIHIDGVYFVRAQAHEIERDLIDENSNA